MEILQSFGTRSIHIRRGAYIAVSLALLLALLLSFSSWRSTPTVSRSGLWVDEVRVGDMIRKVGGTGTLVPGMIRVIPASSDGQVQECLVQPGSKVRTGDVILVLSNPGLEQAEKDAEWKMKGAEADYRSLKAQLDNQLLDLRTQASTIRSDLEQAKLQADTNLQLYKLNLAADLLYKLSQEKVKQLTFQSEMAEKRERNFEESIQAQLAGEQAKVEQLRSQEESKKTLVTQLQVRPGIDGVLQDLLVEVGQQVTVGTILARVVQPKNFRAELKIAETQARDIQLGQKALIDIHDGVIPGHVSRIAPAVQNGRVTVEVALEGRLPQGARPDLSVDGTIEVGSLNNVSYIHSTLHGDVLGSIVLFKLVNGGTEAVRVPVQLGSVSSDKTEILRGLQIGDQVILSDMSAWRNYGLVRLK